MASAELVSGVKNNAVALLLLFFVARGFAVEKYVLLACGVQLAVFLAHGLPQNSEKYYDLSGSATHLALAARALAQPTPRSARQLFLGLASIVWATRLGTFLSLRIAKDGRDGRFDKLKAHPVRFLSAWTIQALWVTLIQLPVILANDRYRKDAPLSSLDALCFALWAAGFALEAVSDAQKFVFRCDPANRDKFICEGAWKYARQPNYCGEIAMWSALAACAILAAVGQPDVRRASGAGLSPAFTAFLLLKVSGLPMNDRAAKKKWGADPRWQHYMRHTSTIVPWTPAPPYQESSFLSTLVDTVTGTPDKLS
mmetsp:Transcript_6088/g.19205  ORF Transcript_6088/g.19205 Transcript_6088/m.19205 type:complete len:312 (+) Transcript_6088:248-1183(+)